MTCVENKDRRWTVIGTRSRNLVSTLPGRLWSFAARLIVPADTLRINTVDGRAESAADFWLTATR